MYFGDSATTDLIFEVDGKQYNCHKSVVCTKSAFLSEFFTSDPNCRRVRISNATPEAFSALLMSFYDGPNFVSQLAMMQMKHILSCWEVALRFRIQPVASQCVAAAHRSMTKETSSEVITACEKHLSHSTQARELATHAHALLGQPESKPQPQVIHQNPASLGTPVHQHVMQPPPTRYNVTHNDLVSTPSTSYRREDSTTPMSSVSTAVPPPPVPQQPLSRQSSRDLVEMCANVNSSGSQQVRQRYLQYLNLYNRQRQYLEHQCGVVKELEVGSTDASDGLRILRLTHSRLLHEIRALEHEVHHFRAQYEDNQIDTQQRFEEQEQEEKAVISEITAERTKAVQIALARAKDTLLKGLESELEAQKVQYQDEMRSWMAERATLLEQAHREDDLGLSIQSLEAELQSLEKEEASLLDVKMQVQKEIDDNDKYDAYTRQYIRAAGVAKQELTTLFQESRDPRATLAAYQHMKKKLHLEVQNAEGRVSWMKEKVFAETDQIRKLRESMAATKSERCR